MVKIIRTDSQTPAATPRLENEKDLTSMIMDMETKHGEILPSYLCWVYCPFMIINCKFLYFGHYFLKFKTRIS